MRYGFGDTAELAGRGILDEIYPEKPAYEGAEINTWYFLGPVRVDGSDVKDAGPTTDDNGGLAVQMSLPPGWL